LSTRPVGRVPAFQQVCFSHCDLAWQRMREPMLTADVFTPVGLAMGGVADLLTSEGLKGLSVLKC
jgi:hypothetical protein